MKIKRKFRKLSFEEAFEIVSAWHKNEATQAQLAERYGVDGGHVSRLCSGDVRPDVFAAVAAAEEGA